jgi:hypothetical protein
LNYGAVFGLRREPETDSTVAWQLLIFCSLVACASWGSWRFRMLGDLGLIVLAATLALHAQKRGVRTDGIMPLIGSDAE